MDKRFEKALAHIDKRLKDVPEEELIRVRKQAITEVRFAQAVPFEFSFDGGHHETFTIGR